MEGDIGVGRTSIHRAYQREAQPGFQLDEFFKVDFTPPGSN